MNSKTVEVLHRALSDVFGAPHADMILADPPGPHFGAFFAAVERQSPRLARHRLRLSDCSRELPRLQELLATAESANGPDLAQFAFSIGNRATV